MGKTRKKPYFCMGAISIFCAFIFCLYFIVSTTLVYAAKKDSYVGERFHRQTKLQRGEFFKDWSILYDPGRRLPTYKTYPGSPKIKLPEARFRGLSLEEAIEERRTMRAFSGEPLSLPELSQLLYSAAGITAKAGGLDLRAAPSHGEAYSIEIYPLVKNVSGLTPGLYHYLPKGHSLELIKEGDILINTLCADYEYLPKAAVIFFFTAVPARSTTKFDNRGYRYIYMEAGHVSQNIYLEATSLGLGSVSIGSFYDDEVNSFLGVDGRSEFCVYAHVVGKPSVNSVENTSENYYGIWVVDESDNNVVIKLSLDGERELARIRGFDNPTYIDVDERDGSVWITDTANDRVVKYSADGKTKLLELKGFLAPYHCVLDIAQDVIWVAGLVSGEVIKFSLEGKELLRIGGLGRVHELILSLFDGSIWVGDQTAKKFIRFSSDGKKLGITQRRLGAPLHLAIDPEDGTAWATFQSPGRVAKFSKDGEFLALVEGFSRPYGITIDPHDRSVWVTDNIQGELVKISSDGERILKKIKGFDRCRGLSVVDGDEKTFWMGNWGKGEIIKFSTAGEILQTIDVGGHPRFVVVYKSSKEN